MRATPWRHLGALASLLVFSACGGGPTPTPVHPDQVEAAVAALAASPTATVRTERTDWDDSNITRKLSPPLQLSTEAGPLVDLLMLRCHGVQDCAQMLRAQLVSAPERYAVPKQLASWRAARPDLVPAGSEVVAISPTLTIAIDPSGRLAAVDWGEHACKCVNNYLFISYP